MKAGGGFRETYLTQLENMMSDKAAKGYWARWQSILH